MLILQMLAAAVLPMLATIGLAELVGRLCELSDKVRFKRSQKLGKKELRN